MKTSKLLKTLLLVSGLLAMTIGAAILINPTAFYALNEIDLGKNIGLLNEIRASGGMLLAAGILISLGVVVARLTFTSIVVATLLYLSYGLSRILGFILDGIPGDGLVHAAILEMVIGVICLWAYTRFRNLPTGIVD